MLIYSGFPMHENLDAMRDTATDMIIAPIPDIIDF